MGKFDCRDKEDIDFKLEEFEPLLLRAKEGDIKARADIVERLKPLVQSSIRRYFNDYRQYEDLLQDGNLMILECIADFDPSGGYYFLGYIKSCLKFMYLDKHKIRVHTSLNTPLGNGSSERVDLLVSDDMGILHSIVEDEDVDLLNRALEVLTKRQREVVELYYLEGVNMIKIAELLHVNYRTVINTKARALEKLKKEISRQNSIPL